MSGLIFRFRVVTLTNPFNWKCRDAAGDPGFGASGVGWLGACHRCALGSALAPNLWLMVYFDDLWCDCISQRWHKSNSYLIRSMKDLGSWGISTFRDFNTLFFLAQVVIDISISDWHLTSKEIYAGNSLQAIVGLLSELEQQTIMQLKNKRRRLPLKNKHQWMNETRKLWFTEWPEKVLTIGSQ